MSGDTRYSMNCRLPIANCRLKRNRKPVLNEVEKSKIENRKSAIPYGFLLTELIVALSILGVMLAGLAMSLYGFAKFNRYQLTRQQCIAAAQAQLDSIAATGGPIPDEDFSRLWPKLTAAIKEAPGAGQWRGLTLVQVTASGKVHRKDVAIQLARYIRRDEPLAEGKR